MYDDGLGDYVCKKCRGNSFVQNGSVQAWRGVTFFYNDDDDIEVDTDGRAETDWYHFEPESYECVDCGSSFSRPEDQLKLRIPPLKPGDKVHLNCMRIDAKVKSVESDGAILLDGISGRWLDNEYEIPTKNKEQIELIGSPTQTQ